MQIYMTSKDIWAKPKNLFLESIILHIPSVEQHVKNKYQNSACELHDAVANGELTCEQAQELWETAIQDNMAELDHSDERQGRLDECQFSVSATYREPIKPQLLPNPYAHEIVMLWQEPLENQVNMDRIAVEQYYSRGLICFGRPGTGKTRSVYARLIDLFVTQKRVFKACLSTALAPAICSLAFTNVEELESFVSDLVNTPVLFIDDICKIKLTRRLGQELYRIIEHRTHQYRRPIIVTTQLTGNQLIEQFVSNNENMRDIAESIVRRLRDYCDSVDFDCKPDVSNITQTNTERADNP